MLLLTSSANFYLMVLLSGFVSSLPVGMDTLECDAAVPDEQKICCEKRPVLNDDACILTRLENRHGSPYHEFICVNPTEDGLHTLLLKYSSAKCDVPVKIYLPELNFMPNPEIFESVAAHLNSLTIKSWNPYPTRIDFSKMPISDPAQPRTLEGSPFKLLNRLKILDICFSGSATFSQLSREFFDGLDDLEALHIENLPPGASIAKGALPDSSPKNSLKCLGLLSSTIPCSCKADDAGHWFHHWMHQHKHTWTAEGRDKISYTDEETSEGIFFLCEVKVKCLMTVEEFNGTMHEGHSGLKVEVPFHHFHWATRCVATTESPTTTAIPSETKQIPKEPCQTRSERSADGSDPLNSTLDDTLCPSRNSQDSETRQLAEDQPIVQAIVSTGSIMIYKVWISFIPAGLVIFWNRKL